MEPDGQYWPNVHGVTVDVVGSGQELPEGHGLQLMLAVRLQAPATYWPDPHTPHPVHAGASRLDEYDTPSTHSAQVAFCEVVHADATYDPGEHLEHFVYGHALLVAAAV
jgi:hypothetical protein